MEKLSVTKVRNNFRHFLASLKEKRIIIITKKDKDLAVAISINFYKKLMYLASKERQRTIKEAKKNSENRENVEN